MRSLPLVASALLLAPLACGESTDAPVPEQARSSLQRANPTVPPADLAAAVAGNTRFDLDVYAQLRSQPGNLFYSSHSLVSALAMTYVGARGTTATELASALHFGLPDAQLHPAFNALDRALTAPPAHPGDFQLTIDDALWGQKGFTFLAPFLDALATNYGAGMNLLDFERDAEASRAFINAYIASRTNDLIPELLPEGSIGSDTRLVLTNAIYFKADWVEAFEPADTRPADFHLRGGSKVSVPTMHGIAHGKHARLEGYDALALPYKGERISMLILVPDAGTFETFEAGLAPDVLTRAVGALAPAAIELAMPKFSLDQKVDGKAVLEALGVHAAFDDADFSGISTDAQLQISDILHQAVVKVDEKGTEAAAATAVVVGVTSVPVSDVRIDLDRPFVFFIRDDATGALLFSGRLVDPS